jgi:uncharacterized membrane protein
MFKCYNWHTVKLFVISFIAFVAMDSLWISYLMKDLYREKFSFADMQETGMFGMKCLLALVVWALIVKGIVIFVLPRTHGLYSHALFKGGLYGLIVYGSYELTNYIVLADWPMEMVRYDIAWGVFICAIVSVIGVYAAHLCGCENMCGVSGKGKNACL